MLSKSLFSPILWRLAWRPLFPASGSSQNPKNFLGALARDVIWPWTRFSTFQTFWHPDSVGVGVEKLEKKISDFFGAGWESKGRLRNGRGRVF